MTTNRPSSCCTQSNACQPSQLDRRDLLRIAGTASASLALAGFQGVMAGPFTVDDFESLVPADKKLSDQWVKSLFERGTPAVYTGGELRYIGMPVGGICCGQVYLGGDGRLWHWDVFHKHIVTRGQHYRDPMQVDSPVDIGFKIRIDDGSQQQVRSLDATGFSDIRFRGSYPIGRVDYVDDTLPVNISLEAFSPFIPLDVQRSSFPATVMRYTVVNRSSSAVTCKIAGHLANPVCVYSAHGGGGDRRNTVRQVPGATVLHATAEETTSGKEPRPRTEIVFEDFEGAAYEKWDVEGTAFDVKPVVISQMPKYQGDVGGSGKQLVNSHNTRQGEDVVQGDRHVGTMKSSEFTVERNYIHFLIGGGNHPGRTCLNLIVDGKVVRTQAGDNNNRLKQRSFDVAEFEGKQARLQIVDQVTGSWGNIGVDRVVFSDTPLESLPPLEQRYDFGDMALAVLNDGDGFGSAQVDLSRGESACFSAGTETSSTRLGSTLNGSTGRSIELAPQQQVTVTFIIAWRFPNAPVPVGKGLHYAERFSSAMAVIEQLAKDLDGLYAKTRLWHDTWYDSTLPYWFLDRTFINASTLATSTCVRVGGGRFFGWEGVRCCPGTCLHVWHYAQSVARLFPSLERETREHVDFGPLFHGDGRIRYRGEYGPTEAIDGQCGTILRVLREHQMSADDQFLRRVWPRVKKAIQYVMRLDPEADGILEGKQYNTLDAAWYGKISWISSLYLAALRAGEQMAREFGDNEFAKVCQEIADGGAKKLTEELFNGEYYFQRRDQRHTDAFGAGIGCHIDQVFGQGWAFQVGLPRVLPKEQTTKALQSLWKYNFTPDVGPYRKKYQTGRWYAMPGEAGLIMCTFPKGGEREARGGKPTHGFAGYLNECMNGFEYQAAGHMIAEGLVKEGLAVTRAIHDRYAPSRRNPYNEIECGDHYARSMASFGVYISACGFQYHGPKGFIGFAPKLTPENFRAAFVGAEGWGTFEQKTRDDAVDCVITLKHGALKLKVLSLMWLGDRAPNSVEVLLDGRSVTADVKPNRQANDVQITFDDELSLVADNRVNVRLS